MLHERLRRIDFLSDGQTVEDEGLCEEKNLEEDEQLSGELYPKDKCQFEEGLCLGCNGQSNEKMCLKDGSRLHGNLCLDEYDGILVDEVHLLTAEKLKILLELRKDQPVIFSSDCEDMISPEEADRSTMRMIEQLPGILSFHLTNRIRTNAELSSFIQNIMHFTRRKNQKGYPDILVVYANDKEESRKLLNGFVQQGYELPECLEDADICEEDEREAQEKQKTEEIANSAYREVKAIVEVLDERYYYDAQGYLRSKRKNEDGKSDVRGMFHRLNLAKEKMALVVERNEEVYEVLLEVVSGGR